MTVKINAFDLHTIAPSCMHFGDLAEPLQAAMDEFEISVNKYRVAAFLAHVMVESDNFNRLRENLYYSTAGRLMEVWPTRFPTAESTIPYLRNPEALANKVYADRLGNGGSQSGDGWRFRGGGFVMVTGKANFISAGYALKVPLEFQPELIEQKKIAARSAGYFWSSHGLNVLADAIPGVPEDQDFLRETKIINGGYMGLKDRQAAFKRGLEIL